MSEPNFSINFTARILATEDCEVGHALVFDSAAVVESVDMVAGWWKVATAANRTTANARTQAIALTAYGGGTVGRVAYQSSGTLAAAVSGLPAAGSEQLVRASTTGRIERVSSYTSGDDILGWAEPDGRVHLALGVPWASIEELAGEDGADGAQGEQGPPGPTGADGGNGAIYSLAEMSRSAQLTVGTAAGDFTIGQLFYASQDALSIIGVKFYWGTPNKDVKVSLWDASNTQLKTATVSVTTAGIYFAYFTQALTMGSAYRISCYQTDGGNISKATAASAVGVVMARPYFVNTGYVVQGSDRYHAGDAHPDTVTGTDLYLMDPIFDGAEGGNAADGPAGDIDGLTARLARISDDPIDGGVWICDAADSDSAVMGGAVGTTYTVSIRIVGVAETKHYTGGTNDGAYWQVGGSPSTDLQGPNLYWLTVSSPAATYYLNRGTGAASVVVLDYQKDIQVDAGATVTLHASSVAEIDSRFRELSHATSVAGIFDPAQPYAGQFVTIQVQAVTA